jgi:hypothetical protein
MFFFNDTQTKMEDEDRKMSATQIVHVTVTILSLTFTIYLTLNIVGTVYYTKLGTQQTPALLMSVIIGWLVPVLSPLNLASPITYCMKK